MPIIRIEFGKEKYFFKIIRKILETMQKEINSLVFHLTLLLTVLYNLVLKGVTLWQILGIKQLINP